MNEIPLSVLFWALFVLLIVSGFFSIAETSMMALNRYRLKHLVQEGSHAAKLTSDLLARTDRLLGVILLGNNLVNAASATLSTVITVRLLGDNEYALTVATLAVTFAILVFSEISPKIVGAAYPERIALPASYILTPMLKIAYPVVWFVNLFVRSLLWIVRLSPPKDDELQALSPQELRSLILEAGTYIPKKHKSILLNLFELEKISVDDVMTPRNQIEAIDISADIDEIVGQLSTSYHTRVPVYEGELDNVVGFVHVRRVLHQTRLGELTIETLKEVMREPYFIPEGTPLFTQLQAFQENQQRVGLVVDEYGELLGLCTLEDILEEIVGEFTTQAPTSEATFRPQPDSSWLIDGSVALRSINRKLGIGLPVEGPKTLNGLILEHLEDIPEPGTTFKIAGHPVEIVQTQGRAVKVARVYPALKDNEGHPQRDET